ncbi:general stress protein [Pantoea sp. UBA4549]|uniref:general stress protein n=1 Tax=Pantoea sp. UBA4549 TaxID=1947033 RepID=UPI0039C93BC7
MLTQHQGGAGNFAEETQRISEAGKKGGKNSGTGLKNDREKSLTLAKKDSEWQLWRLTTGFTDESCCTGIAHMIPVPHQSTISSAALKTSS